MASKIIPHGLEIPAPGPGMNAWDAEAAGAPITIAATATAVPEHAITIANVKEYLNKVFPLSESRVSMMLDVIANAKVEKRYFVYPVDYTVTPRSLTQTSLEYQEHAVKLGKRVTEECLERAGLTPEDVDMIISVSCTGVMLPSLDAYLINALGFRSDVRRLPITELGCSGGAAALGRAWDFLKGVNEGNVLIVVVELPSLTFQRRDQSIANLISSILFGDGAAAVMITRGSGAAGMVEAGNGESSCPQILGAQTHIVPNTMDALGFDLKDNGLHIVLSQDVPHLVREKIAGIVDGFLGRHGLSHQDMSAFVLHSGGQKLLTHVEEVLNLPRELTQFSWDVLKNYGNQSSASVLFVLQEWMRKARLAEGDYGFLAAFGPGFTVDMVLLQWT
ncbi:MAG TPA: 3-oxoacyl-[acyl-carrier-protein] synthase III C-terminal domain-containing protein [Candidatus Limnocylindrales bacterium]|nr:3-oxoacyl-[acyl-carrier-protein] synthase III C-terminal domain-containing protein [Candidatus Limnocylindrales bacterium]